MVILTLILVILFTLFTLFTLFAVNDAQRGAGADSYTLKKKRPTYKGESLLFYAAISCSCHRARAFRFHRLIADLGAVFSFFVSYTACCSAT